MKIALLVFVIFIWGKVIMDFLKYKKEEKPQFSKTILNETPKLVLEKFEYDLNLDYRDPFLGKYPRSNPKLSSPSRVSYSKPKPQAIKDKPKPLVKWPKIEYVGNIQNFNKNTESVTLRVNGEESFMLPGQAIQGVSLMKLYPDSMLLSYKEELKTFRR